MSSASIDKIRALRAKALTLLEKLRPVALLLARLGVGMVFMSTGWGKVHSIDKVTGFFVTLGIPMPHLNAIVAGYSELLCGTALVLGVMSRLATIPLIVTMIVAIITAKREDLHNLFDLFGFDEFTYLILLVMIAILGPGKYAVDHLIARKIEGSPGAGKS